MGIRLQKYKRKHTICEQSPSQVTVDILPSKKYWNVHCFQYEQGIRCWNFTCSVHLEVKISTWLEKPPWHVLRNGSLEAYW